jgi:hypothetical protein
MNAKIQFIKGLDEKVLPDIRLTRSRWKHWNSNISIESKYLR